MRRYLIAGAVIVVALAGRTVPALAQAKESAEASAAASANPKWTSPKLAWGHPDLQGIWTSDDMRGIPMSRPPQFGSRPSLTDEEFTQRAMERGKYGCHEGNGAVRNSLSGERAYEKEAAVNTAKGLPPPERVFERVNGEDRGR